MKNQTIKRTDIVKVFSKTLNMPLSQSTQLMEFLIEEIKQNLCQSKNVKIMSFGNFEIHDRAARIGRNPKTKQEYLIKPRKVLVFKAAQAFKNRVINS